MGSKSVRETFRIPSDVDVATIDPRGRPIGPKDKSAAADAMADLGTKLDGLQEALTAEAPVVARGRCCWCCRAWTPPARAG